MKKVIVLLLLFVSLSSVGFSAENGQEWIDASKIIMTNTPLFIPEADIYEVVASKEYVAVDRLKEKSIIKIDEKTAKWYTGHYYKCPEGKHPYLVRAVYGHGGTGKYTVKGSDENLLILHESLGKKAIFNKSALVINLEGEPKKIIIRVGIDE